MTVSVSSIRYSYSCSNNLVATVHWLYFLGQIGWMMQTVWPKGSKNLQILTKQILKLGACYGFQLSNGSERRDSNYWALISCWLLLAVCCVLIWPSYPRTSVKNITKTEYIPGYIVYGTDIPDTTLHTVHSVQWVPQVRGILNMLFLNVLLT